MNAPHRTLALAAEATDMPSKPYEVRDCEDYAGGDGTFVVGLVLRVQPSGRRSWYAQVARGKRVLIGAATEYTLDMARTQAHALGLRRFSVREREQFMSSFATAINAIHRGDELGALRAEVELLKQKCEAQRMEIEALRAAARTRT